MNSYVQHVLDRSLVQPVNDFLSVHGKRIRSSLLQFSFELSGGVGDVDRSVSEAIESLHAGSLIIDDIQDESQTRRGQATLHNRIGTPLAINAGNWLYFHALESLLSAPIAENKRQRLLATMIRSSRQCHEGQAIDLHARIDNIPTDHWRDTITAISTLKTGILVSLAVEMGCVAANPHSPMANVLPKFGRQVGTALQMRNDLEELNALAQNGTEQCSTIALRDDDLRNARLTWPWVWALESVGSSVCQNLMKRLINSKGDRHEVAVELIALIGDEGDRAIKTIVSELLRLLAEHVVDPRMLEQLSLILRPIESPGGAPIEPQPSGFLSTPVTMT